MAVLHLVNPRHAELAKWAAVTSPTRVRQTGLLRCADSGPAEARRVFKAQIAMASSSKATITRRVTGSSVANS